MPRPLLPSLASAVVLVGLAGAGSACETHTCQSACRKIYFECNGGSGMQPVIPENTRDEAYDQCVEACGSAMYSTTRTDGDDGAGVEASYDLHTPDDALAFIDCVEHVELADPQCVTDFDAECKWIRW